MESLNNNSLNVSKFDGSDFAVWRAQMLAMFTAKGLDSVLKVEKPLGGTTDENKTELANYLRIERQARPLLLLALDNKHAKLVLKCETTKEMWNKLSTIHEQASSANKLILQKQFFELQMKNEETVQDFVSRAEYLYGKLQDIGVNSIDESTVVSKIVTGLTKRYLNFMSNWSNMSPADQTLEKLLPRLMNEEALISKFEKTDTGDALIANNSKEFKGKRNERTRKPSGRCFICKQEGHWKNECPKKNEHEGTAMIAESEANFTSTNKDWIIDSGASEHMTFDRDSYVSYKPLQTTRLVRFGNNENGKGIGIGDIKVKSEIGTRHWKTIILKNVLHVPELKRKLFSVSATTTYGSKGYINNETIILRDKTGRIQIIGNKQGGLYRANLEEIPTNALVSNSTSELKLWHKRLAHVNQQTIQEMMKYKSVDGLSTIAEEEFKKSNTSICSVDCEPCILGKQHRKHFPSSSKDRASQVGQRIHVDICGPIGEPTISGSKYFILFKDEFSNFRHIYFMKSTKETENMIRKYLARFKSQTLTNVLTIVSDNGSEFTSNKVQEMLLKFNIAHEKSTAYVPQQNGFIERDNRTILEAARAMLVDKNLPDKLWGEAANTAVYTINRVINKNTRTKTPHELYFGKKPRVNHLRIFGSLCYKKQEEKKRSGYQQKLEHRSKPVIMVGYERDNTYRTYDPIENKVIISREIIFDETKQYNWGTLIKPAPKYFEIFLDGLESEAKDNPDNENDNHSGEPDKDASESFRTVSDPDDEEPKIDQTDKAEHNEDPTTPQSSGSKEDDQPPMIPSKTKARKAFEKRTLGDYGLRPRENNLAEALVVYGSEPNRYEDALSANDNREWIKAMDDEFNSLMKNQTWDLVNLPNGRKPIKCKWVFKIKCKADGSVERYKARLVAKGYSQKPGIDYSETFSPVVRLDSIRLILSMVTKMDLEMCHFDIKTAFLYGHLEEEIYMDQPEGYIKDTGKVCRLKRSLYGLKQAPRAWNKCFSDFLSEFELEPLVKDSCIFMKRDKSGEVLIIALYVDDGLVCSSSITLLEKVIFHLRQRFEIKTMDPSCFVGLEIRRERNRGEMFITQKHYIERVAKRFSLDNSKDVATPMIPNQQLCIAGAMDGKSHDTVEVPYKEAIGSLMYAMIGCRPDIAHSVNFLARFSEAPKMVHWNAIKRVIQYLNTTSCLGIKYEKNNNKTGLECHVDSDLAGDIDTRRSTSGYVISYNGCTIIWRSKRQPIVTTSTVEAEFVAASLACKDVLWTRQLLEEINLKETDATKLFTDNQGAIHLIQNNQIHANSKHIDRTYMFIRELYENKQIKPVYICGQEQRADIFTKAITRDRFRELRSKLGVE